MASSALAIVPSTSPLDRLLHAVESFTGRRPRRSGNGYRLPCTVCGGPSYRSYKAAASEATNGAILLKPFCGCTAADYVHAIGLSLGDLFPVRLAPQTPEERRIARQQARLCYVSAAVRVLHHEAHVLAAIAGMLRAGSALTDELAERLQRVVDRVEDAKATLT